MRALIPIMFVTIVLISCDKDDPKPASLVGKWQVTDTNFSYQVDGQPFKDYLISQGMSESEAQAAVDQLDEENNIGTFDATFEFTESGTWIITQKDGDDIFNSVGTWKLNDDRTKLTLTDNDFPDEPDTATVTKFTNTELEFDLLLVADEDNEDDEWPPIDYLLTFKLKKI